MNETIRLYRFLPACSALLSIQNRNLRISRISGLNDPFEWRVGVLGLTEEEAPDHDDRMRKFINSRNEEFGLISFSKTCSEPLLWGHYADSHQGVALGFDYAMTPGNPVKIRYEPRPTIDRGETANKNLLLEVLQETLDIKYVNWNYEEEYRVYPRLNETTPINTDYFLPIPYDSLKQVILGYNCKLEEDYVRKILQQSGLEATVTRARLCHEEYKVLVDYNA
jgi:hypothetical protein